MSVEYFTPTVSQAFTAKPHVNGVVLIEANENIDATTLRQRACTELLRQAAIQQGLLSSEDPAPQAGIISEVASQAIEALLDQQLSLPEPDEAAYRRYHAAHAARYVIGERIHVRHILFAVTPGVDVQALRQRAETCLLDVRTTAPAQRDACFADAAHKNSNCPSGAQGGDLGWLTAADCAPEFARELFGQIEIGVLPRLVHSRHGLHVVEVLAREAGEAQPFEQVRAAVMQTLYQQSFATALSQYLRLLAGAAQMEGVELEAASTPLVQ
jgi:peptidyl-prolyl cis-trans isomerase C